jgi:hypothetical protein
MRVCLGKHPVMMSGSRSSPSSVRLRKRLVDYKARIAKMEVRLFENCESICKLYGKENYLCYSKECFEMHHEMKALLFKIEELEDELEADV